MKDCAHLVTPRVEPDSAYPRVSVIVPSFNTGHYIARALDSVLDTGYPELELVIVDDGSQDDSVAIIEDYQRRTSAQIVLLTHPRHRKRGIAASRNLGIRSATGTYIVFLDADDRFLKSRFDVCIPLLENDPSVEAVCEPFFYVYESGERGKEIGRCSDLSDGKREACGLVAKPRRCEEMFMDLLETRILPHTGSITIRTSVLRETGLFPKLSYCLEPALWYKIYARNKVRDGSRTPVSEYTLHARSACALNERTARFVYEYTAGLMDAYCWMRRHGIRREYQDAVRRLALGKFAPGVGTSTMNASVGSGASRRSSVRRS